MAERYNDTSDKGWRRTAGLSSADAVWYELAHRELRNLDICKRAWKDDRNPLALCEAVVQSKLPTWLADGLLVMLTENQQRTPAIKRGLWRAFDRHMIRALYAYRVGAMRGNSEAAGSPIKLEAVHAYAAEWIDARVEGIGKITLDNAKKAFYLVRSDLAAHPWRYYDKGSIDYNDRVVQAWEREGFSSIIQSPKKTRRATRVTRELARRTRPRRQQSSNSRLKSK